MAIDARARMRSRLLRTSAAALLTLATATATASLADARRIDMDVSARAIEAFDIGSDQQQFGELTFDGGLELYATSRHFGALSGIALYDGQTRFIGVADTGFWYAGEIKRDAAGRATGMTDVHMWSISGPNGETDMDKWDADAEGVTVEGDRVFVSFERNHRIAEYRLNPDGPPTFVKEAPPPVDLKELRRNKGFEMVAIAPDGTPLGGSRVGVSERSLDRNGNMMAYVIPPDGKSWQFSVKRNDEFDITDGKFLPGGDLVLLERRFNMTDGVAMRLRRISVADIAPGATVDGERLLDADMGYQIDNMEGLAITTDPDGTPRLTMVSDDNHSLLQRSLLLEFRLTGPKREAKTN